MLIGWLSILFFATGIVTPAALLLAPAIRQLMRKTQFKWQAVAAGNAR